MIERNKNPGTGRVLFAFHRKCERPTALQMIAWTERYPQFADDIREHAAVRPPRASDENRTLNLMRPCWRAPAAAPLNLLHATHQESEAAQKVSENLASGSVGRRLQCSAACAVHQCRSHGYRRIGGGAHASPLGHRLSDALTDALGTTPLRWTCRGRALGRAAALEHAKADSPDHPHPILRGSHSREPNVGGRQALLAWGGLKRGRLGGYPAQGARMSPASPC